MKFLNRIVYLALLVAVVFTGDSCRKRTFLHPEYFIFGVWYVECEGDCARYYLYENDKLYKDDFEYTMRTLRKNKYPLRFNRGSLSDAKRDVARELFETLPQYLLEHKNETFGSPNSHDQGELFIELKMRGEEKIRWLIDADRSKIPVELRAYAKEVESKILYALR